MSELVFSTFEKPFGVPQMPIRQPIVTVLGHVDVGKTLLLDKIRGSAVMAREVGAMTTAALPWW
ncbi:MAG: hypothetical protein ABC536_03010 [Candidatus Methanosuratincola petrocarbonis]